jgi:hypothetical protein
MESRGIPEDVPISDIVIALVIWIGLNMVPAAFIGVALLRERPRPDRPVRSGRTHIVPAVV